MGKKGNLLTEAQVRQFMKLANLKPLTPGFVDGLDESAPVDESHGRGRGEGAAGYGHPDDDRAGARLREAEDEFPEDELGPDEPDAEELEPVELEPEELPRPPEEDVGDVDAREVNVDDFLAALEVALEDVLGDEVEVDQEEEAEEVEPEADVEEIEPMEEPLPGEEVPELQEMINKITKRVAKRIVKEALQNKK